MHHTDHTGERDVFGRGESGRLAFFIQKVRQVRQIPSRTTTRPHRIEAVGQAALRGGITPIDPHRGVIVDIFQWTAHDPNACNTLGHMAEWTRLELATSGVTGRRSNQLSYHSMCPKLERES
jgi:hypothetical protein